MEIIALKLWAPDLTAAIERFLAVILLNRPLLELVSEGENHKNVNMTLFMGLVLFSCLSVILLAFL
ncbi:MAG: hypothetical protein ACLT64_07490 [Streptococcus salivarius]